MPRLALKIISEEVSRRVAEQMLRWITEIVSKKKSTGTPKGILEDISKKNLQTNPTGIAESIEFAETKSNRIFEGILRNEIPKVVPDFTRNFPDNLEGTVEWICAANFEGIIWSISVGIVE